MATHKNSDNKWKQLQVELEYHMLQNNMVSKRKSIQKKSKHVLHTLQSFYSQLLRECICTRNIILGWLLLCSVISKWTLNNISNATLIIIIFLISFNKLKWRILLSSKSKSDAFLFRLYKHSIYVCIACFLSTWMFTLIGPCGSKCCIMKDFWRLQNVRTTFPSLLYTACGNEWAHYYIIYLIVCCNLL